MVELTVAYNRWTELCWPIRQIAPEARSNGEHGEVGKNPLPCWFLGYNVDVLPAKYVADLEILQPLVLPEFHSPSVLQCALCDRPCDTEFWPSLPECRN